MEKQEEDLLYDILVYREWPQSQDHRSSSISEIDSISLTKNSWFTFLTNWSASASKVVGFSDPPPEVLKLLQATPAWKFSLSPDGTLLAVLQETLLEFYSSKDNFAISIAKVRVTKDVQPHLRLIEWSPDSSLLVVTSSLGAVDLFDAFGFLVYSVFSQRLPQNEANSNGEEFNGIQSKGYAYAGAFFSSDRVKSREWLYELILVDYRGRINSFLLSPSGYQEFSSMSLTCHYKYGVSAVTFSLQHGLLCVAGPVTNSTPAKQSLDKQGPSEFGLTVWRLTNEAPHYNLVLPHDHCESSNRWFFQKPPDQDHIFRLEESPNGELLCALHVSGNVTIWQMPGLHQATLWHLEEQPCHDDMNPNLMQNPRLKKRKKQFLNNNIKWHPLDVKWWDEQSLVIARFSGGVTIIGLKNLDKNMLGDSAEFFAGTSHLSKCFGKGFFVLEREITDRRQKKRSQGEEDDESFEKSLMEPPLESEEDDEDEDASLFCRGKKMATNLAYLVTESERFAPPRKRPRLTYHNYKLLGLLSTTPEELYSRKIEMEEYGEALILAQHYNLDSDQVYERQWKLSNLSTSAISDYLSKIKRRSLVLRECLNTVPNDVEAIRALLEYGLKETDLHVLEMMEEDESEGRYVKPLIKAQNDDLYLSEEEASEKRDLEEQRLISRISWSDLSVSQRELLAQRHTLIKYLDRLETYVEIVERYQRYEANFFFCTDFYVKFRDQGILEAAIQFAHQGRNRAVATLFQRYSDDLEEYKLCILSNFPESLAPDDYADLIPSIDDLLQPKPNEERKQDWIHYDFIQAKVPEHVLIGSQSTEEEEQNLDIPFIEYRAKVLTRELLTAWIHQRARDIEKESSLVDHSLALLRYASSYCGIAIDLRLHHQLTTLETMLYDLEISLSLDKMEEMSDLEVLLKLTEKSSKNSIISDLRRFLVPYLDRLEQLESGARKSLLNNFLLHCSATSLELPFEVLKASCVIEDSSLDIFLSLEECVNIGLDCIYAYESDEESDLIVEMASFLKKKCLRGSQHLLDEIDDILDIMRAIRLLKRYHIPKTLHYFKACRNDVKAMEDLFVQVTRRAEGKKPRLSPREWSEVLQDLFELRRLIPIVPLDLCLEILCESLLSSEADENIDLVKDIFQYKPADALFKSKSAMLYVLSVYKVGNLSSRSKEKIIGKACEYYLDSAKDVDDPNLALAKKCLNLVPESESSPLLQGYRDMLTALAMLHDFGVSILPIVLRNTTNFVPIVEKIIQLDSGAYQSARKILRMIKLMKSLSSNEDLEEGPILSVVADYALKAEDFNYCLSICEMMMERPSKEACRGCLKLANHPRFVDMTAKAKLCAFVVNYCHEDDIEEMLMQRINLLDDEEPFKAHHSPRETKKTLEEEKDEDDVGGVRNALSKITDKDLVLPVIPESTKVISNLFGKLSKFTAMHQDVREEEEINAKVQEEEEESSLLQRKAKCINLNVFYLPEESHGPRLGLLHSSLENYSSTVANGPIDSTTLSLISKHYRNSFEYDEEDRIEWPILADILQVILQEDTALGLMLILPYLKTQQPYGLFKAFPGLGLYSAALKSTLDLASSTKDLFRFPPGLVYCCCKTLMYQNKLQDELFANALAELLVDEAINE